LDPSSGGRLFNIDSVKDRVELVIGDIVSFEDLMRVVIDKEIIINCAASTSHGLSMSEPWLNLEVNSRGVINLLEAIKRVNSEVAFVHVGTTTQIGPLHYQPADELHPEFPTEMYSANKVVAEKYVLLYSKVYGINASVVRLPNTYGPRAAIDNPSLTFNNFFIGLALKNEAITVYEPGNQLRNILFVDDVVDALITVARSNKSCGEVFFAASDRHYSVKEVAQITCRVIGGRVQMCSWPKEQEVLEIGDVVISGAKIKDQLGWIPKVDLNEGLNMTKRYFLDKMEYYF